MVRMYPPRFVCWNCSSQCNSHQTTSWEAGPVGGDRQVMRLVLLLQDWTHYWDLGSAVKANESLQFLSLLFAFPPPTKDDPDISPSGLNTISFWIRNQKISVRYQLPTLRYSVALAMN